MRISSIIISLISMDEEAKQTKPILDEIEAARRTVGQTTQARARWLLSFAYAGEAILRLRPMRVECAVFLGRDLGTRRKDGYAVNIPRDMEVRQWRRELNRLLDQLRAHQIVTVNALATVIVTYTNTELMVKSSLAPEKEAGRFEIESLNALIAVADQLRFCKNEKCPCALIRNKRQDYCSPRCRDTVNHRMHRRTLAAKPKTLPDQPPIP